MFPTSLSPKLRIVKVLALESIGPNVEKLSDMLSVPGEAIYRGDVPFLLNVNHKGVQFVTPFSKFTMTMYYDF